MINLIDVYDSKAIAVVAKENLSNQIPYLGQAFWPNDKKMSLELKWIKTSSGLPVSLAPSNFDTLPTIRTRSGFQIEKQQMAFFRETMIVSETDQMELLKVEDSNSPFLKDILANIYNDVKTLTEAADVVAERMRMQLLFPLVGGPKILVTADGVQQSYNYDGAGTWATNNRTDLSGVFLWANTETAQPLTDIQTICDKANSKIKFLIMSQATFNLIVACTQVKGAVLAQNPTANIFLTPSIVKQLIKTLYDVEVLIYKKKVKDEAGAEVQLAPDGYVAFVPEGNLGKTWYGVTPEERTALSGAKVDVSVIGGVAIAVTTKYGPPASTETTVSEIVLPSYERMDDVYLLGVGVLADAGDEIDALTLVSADGTVAANTKVTVTEEVPEGYSLKIKAYATGATLPSYKQNLKLWTVYTSGANFPTTNGYEVVVAMVNSKYECIAAGMVVAVVV